MSTTLNDSWPTQLFLPGQAAAPDGPVDMQMMYLMHHAFRRDLAKFAAAAQHTPVEDRATWRLLAARWELFADVLHHHLRRGRRALAVAAGAWHHRGPRDPRRDGGRTRRDRPRAGSLRRGFNRLVSHADDDARAALAVRLVATRDGLARHLAHEETDAMAILQRVMTQEEWTALDEEFFKQDLEFRQVVALVP